MVCNCSIMRQQAYLKWGRISFHSGWATHRLRCEAMMNGSMHACVRSLQSHPPLNYSNAAAWARLCHLDDCTLWHKGAIESKCDGCPTAMCNKCLSQPAEGLAKATGRGRRLDMWSKHAYEYLSVFKGPVDHPDIWWNGIGYAEVPEGRQLQRSNCVRATGQAGEGTAQRD